MAEHQNKVSKVKSILVCRESNAKPSNCQQGLTDEEVM